MQSEDFTSSGSSSAGGAASGRSSWLSVCAGYGDRQTLLPVGWVTLGEAMCCGGQEADARTILLILPFASSVASGHPFTNS